MMTVPLLLMVLRYAILQSIGYPALLVPRTSAGRKGAAVRSKRQHPPRQFASAVVTAASEMTSLVNKYPLKDLSSASAAVAGSFAGLSTAATAHAIRSRQWAPNGAYTTAYLPA